MSDIRDPALHHFITVLRRQLIDDGVEGEALPHHIKEHCVHIFAVLLGSASCKENYRTPMSAAQLAAGIIMRIMPW